MKIEIDKFLKNTAIKVGKKFYIIKKTILSKLLKIKKI